MLRLIADSIRSSGKAWSISADISNTIQSWITAEIEIFTGIVLYGIISGNLLKSGEQQVF